MVFNDALGLEDLIWYIIIGTGVLFFVLIIILFCCCIKRAKRNGRDEALGDLAQGSSFQHRSSDPPAYIASNNNQPQHQAPFSYNGKGSASAYPASRNNSGQASNSTSLNGYNHHHKVVHGDGEREGSFKEKTYKISSSSGQPTDFNYRQAPSPDKPLPIPQESRSQSVPRTISTSSSNGEGAEALKDRIASLRNRSTGGSDQRRSSGGERRRSSNPPVEDQRSTLGSLDDRSHAGSSRMSMPTYDIDALRDSNGFSEQESYADVRLEATSEEVTVGRRPDDNYSFSPDDSEQEEQTRVISQVSDGQFDDVVSDRSTGEIELNNSIGSKTSVEF